MTWFVSIDTQCAVDAETEEQARTAALEWFAETIDRVLSGDPAFEIATLIEQED